MKKYFLISVCSEDFQFGLKVFDTHKEAYEQMEFEYINAVEDDYPMHEGISDNSAYVVGNYEYKWEIREYSVTP